MNRNLNGGELTTEDMLKIAIDNKLMTNEDFVATTATLHNKNLIHSALVAKTMDIRFKMFFRGELKLDSRFNRPDVDSTEPEWIKKAFAKKA